MLYDSAKIHLQAGNGGNGSASLRREKFVPKGGPEGGDGGRGGSIYLQVDPHLNTLLPFRFKQHFKAESGGNGGKQQMHGSAGNDLYIKVPPGTMFYTEPDPEHPERPVSQGDLTKPDQVIMVGRGGKGGLGNVHFTTSTHQAPRMAQNGQPGQDLWLRLELKLIADVGIVGYPNAGKSTLLSVVSAATPKIADYPFTTLEPNLGVVELGDNYSFVLADIPGLIEGAAQGVGLGHDFLRHVERTRLLIHLLDGSGQSGRDPISDYEQINKELAEYSPDLAEKPQIVAVNKVDMPETQENLPGLRRYFEQRGLEIQLLSAVARQGTKEVVQMAARRLQEMPLPEPVLSFDTENNDIPILRPRALHDEKFEVFKEAEDEYRVRGKRIEDILAMTNMDNEEALERLQITLDRTGISTALRRAGIKEGDLVYFGKQELVWQDI